MWLREHVLVLETLAGVSHQSVVGRDVESVGRPECLSQDQRRDGNPSNRVHQDLGGSALGASDSVQRHDFAIGAWKGTRLSGGVRMIWHRCDLKLPSLFGPACCGREATTYDRAQSLALP